MPPVGDKTPSSQSSDSSSRQTRARFNALPENLPGLKTRSGKQIESPKIGKSPKSSSLKQVVTPKSTPKAAKPNSNERCPDSAKSNQKLTKLGPGSANKEKKVKGKLPENDNDECEKNEQPLTKKKNEVHTRSHSQSQSDSKQRKKTKIDGITQSGEKSKKTEKVGRKMDTSVVHTDKQPGKKSAGTEYANEEVEENQRVKVSSASKKKPVKRKISISKDNLEETCSGDTLGQDKAIKKTKHAEENEICSPRRSSRAVIPNRKFKDMKMEWDITMVKKEPLPVPVSVPVLVPVSVPVSVSVSVPDAPVKIETKEEEKTVVRKVEINSFAPGQLIKVTEPIKKKSNKYKSSAKKMSKTDIAVVQKSPEKVPQYERKNSNSSILPVRDKEPADACKPLEQSDIEKKNTSQPETPTRVDENISAEIKPNTTIKIQLPEKKLSDSEADPFDKFDTPVTSPFSDRSSDDDMIDDESPTESDIIILKNFEDKEDTETTVPLETDNKHVDSEREITSTDKTKARTLMKVTSKGMVLINETEYATLQGKSHPDLEYSKLSSAEKQIEDSESSQVSVVSAGTTEFTDMNTEDVGSPNDVLTIELGSEQIEVHDVTDLVTNAAGCIDLKSSNDLSSGNFSVETSEKISQILNKISDTVIETSSEDSSAASLESRSQAKPNLPYRVIPTLNAKNKSFGRIVDLKETSPNTSETSLHGTIKPKSVITIKPQSLNEGEKVAQNTSRSILSTHSPVKRASESVLKVKQASESVLKVKQAPELVLKASKGPAFSYVNEIVVETSSEKEEQNTDVSKDPEYLIISVKDEESDNPEKDNDSENVDDVNTKSTCAHESDFDSSEEGSILNAATGLLEIPMSLARDAKISESVLTTKDVSHKIEECDSNNEKSKNLPVDADEQKETSDMASELASNKSASISTQTPIADKTDYIFDSAEGQSEMKVKTKTISVSVQKPGEELQVKDGEVTAEAQKQEFIIVHLPEGTTIKNYTVQSRHKIEDDVAFTQDDNGQYNCGECNYTTMKKANWYKHKRRHMGQCVKTHACNYCSYRASTSSNLKRHLSIHADIRLFKCGICDLTFRQKIHLERHIKYRHEVKQVRCPLCDYVCANENPDLKVHIKRKHLNPDGNGDSVQAYTCSECGLTTLSRKDLRQHQKFHRKGPELKLFCQHCSFVTDCESRLKRHMYIHTKEKPFECSLCDYRGSQKEHVLRHMRAQHNIEIQRQSRKSFGDSTSNEDSNDGKDGEKNDKADYSSQEKIFACNHCTMKFAKLINLYKHLHSQHKDIMPYEDGDNYQCVVCDFTTNNKKNLLVHMRRHNVVDQSPPSHVYSCVLCRYVNPKRRNLFQHMKKKHNIDIIMKDDGSASCFVTDDNPAVVGNSETNIQTVDNIFTATDSPLQIVTDESASTSGQNVITIQDLAYAVSNPRLVNENDIVIVEQGDDSNNLHFNSLAQHEAAEAIEGLQALAEQPGIFETQTVIEESSIIEDGEVQTTIEELQNVVDDTKVELIETNDMLVEEEVLGKNMLEAGSIEQIITDSKELDGSIQLSAEEVMHLTSGDYVEINGEMYKVEIRTDEAAAVVDTPGEETVEEVVI